MEKLWRALGGRKQLNSYIFTAVITWGWMQLTEPNRAQTFSLFVMALTMALLGIGALHVFEDIQTKRVAAQNGG